MAFAPINAQEHDAEEGSESEASGEAAYEFPERYVHRRKGLLAFSDGIYETAEKFFQQYRASSGLKEPDFTDATILLIRTRLRQDKVEEARQALAFHSENSPGGIDAEYAESLAYWRIAILFAESKFDQALAEARRFLQSADSPDLKSAAMSMMGNAYLRQQEWSRAIAVFSTLIDDYPQSENASDVRFRLTYAYIADGQTEAAAALLDDIGGRAAGEKPGRGVRIRIYRAILFAAGNDLDQAVAVYRSIQERQPQRPDEEWWLLLSRLVIAAMEKKEYALAAELAPAAAAAASNRQSRIDMRLSHAKALMKAGEIAPAVQALGNFKEKYPEAPEALQLEFELAEFLYEQQRYALSAQHFGSVSAAEKGDKKLRYRALIKQGWALVKADKAEDAVAVFAAGARLADDQARKARAFFYAGDAATRVGASGDAAMYYQNVADNFPATEFAEKARFRQAQARADAGLYSDAALVYRQFLQEFPESEMRKDALLERGIALKNAGNYQEAVKVIQNFIETYLDHPDMPRALIEGFAASKADGDPAVALGFLDKLITDHQESDLYVHGLYHRIHYQFLQGRDEEALRDVKTFLAKYARLPLSADVYIWTGDHLANEGQLAEAEDYYLRAATTHPETTQAQVALFEAARCAYRRDKPERAATFLEQLAGEYEPQAMPDLHARGRSLQGDLLAAAGEYQKALEHFRAAASIARDSLLRLGAVGRMGDMFYSLGAAAKEPEQQKSMYQKAVEQYTVIINESEKLPRLREKARYRLAKCIEKRGDSDNAIDAYLDIFYEYDTGRAVEQNAGQDWYYFTRSGYDAARLLVLKNSDRARDNLKNAARIYERIAEAGVPTASEAEQRAAELRRKLAEEEAPQD